MTINKTEENGKTTIALEGRLDTGTAPKLQEELMPVFGMTNEIALDFSRLVYVSSAGLRVLLMAQKESKKKGVPMTLAGVSGEIMEVFEMTGFADMLNII